MINLSTKPPDARIGEWTPEDEFGNFLLDTRERWSILVNQKRYQFL